MQHWLQRATMEFLTVFYKIIKIYSELTSIHSSVGLVVMMNLDGTINVVVLSQYGGSSSIMTCNLLQDKYRDAAIEECVSIEPSDWCTEWCSMIDQALDYDEPVMLITSVDGRIKIQIDNCHNSILSI